ncbi:MAG: AgmX/PglI C-terminal domain-containing protein [Deltaproteobacteria bacterium]|nr:AgmX/PglI C-terminal domain-containing protein [Deltaproteobacteria bacterium]
MGMPINFKIFHGDTLVAQKDFDQDIIKIGRLATAHLKLDDQKVSRIHAVIEVTGGRDVSIIDMGSAEGTFVNGEKVNKLKLKDGDTIVVGDTRLMVGLGAPASLLAPEGSGVFSKPAGVTNSGSRLAPVAAAPSPMPAPVPTPAPVAAPATPPPVQAAPVEAAPPPPPPAAVKAASHKPAPAPAPARAPVPAAAADDDLPEGEYEDDEEGPMETAPEPVPDASRAVLEVQVRWGLTVIEVQHHDHKPVVTFGAGGDIHIDSQEFPPPPKPLFTCSGSSYALNLPPGFSGFIRTGKGLRDLKEGKGGEIPLSPDHSGELMFHDMILAFRFTEPRRKVAAAPFGAVDYGWMNTFMTTIFMSAAFLATLILYPQDTKSLEEDLFQTNNRFTQFIINPEKKPKSDFLKKLEASKGDKGKAAAAYKGDSGKAGKKEVSKDKPQGRMATKAEKRAQDEKVVQDKIAQLFGGGSSSAVFAGGDNNALETAFGGISGRQVGEAYGFGGLGERGHGPGGGGTSTSTFGVGKIGTRGRGGGNSGYGAGGGGLGGKTEHSIDISQGAPVILGSLDKEIIRRVIRENIQQIKYCYERELTRSPGLAGKVGVKFVIGAQGNVQSAVVAESTLNNKSAESCVTGKVRGWIFPKPKGGGIVIVTYPFIFKQGG